MAIGVKMETEIFPENGSKVINSTNRKDNFGITSVSDAVSVSGHIADLFRKKEIGFSALGGSAFGLSIMLPDIWFKARPVSNVIEFQICGNDIIKASEILNGEKWEKVNPKAYFSVTFLDGSGKQHTSPTIRDQLLFSKKFEGVGESFLMLIQVPTEFYRVKNGKIIVEQMHEMQTPGMTFAYKITRGLERDRWDALYVSLANEVPMLLRGKGLELIYNMTATDRGAAVRTHSLTKYVMYGLKHFEEKREYKKIARHNREFFGDLVAKLEDTLRNA